MALIRTRALAAFAFAFTLAGASLAVGCGRAGPAEPPPHAIAVRVAAAGPRDLAATARLSGRIAPPVDRQALVSSAVAGQVRDVAAREGQAVRAGEVLAHVDPRSLDDAARSAEASLKRARAESVYKEEVSRRSRELVEKGVASRQEAESDAAAAVAAEAAVVEATTAVANARRSRGFADVAAPFDGVVVRVLRHPGEQVDGTPATAIAEIGGLHPLEVALDAPAGTLSRLRPGDEALVTVTGASGAGDRLGARVSRVAGSLDAASLVGGVRLRFVGPDPSLALGTPVEVELRLGKAGGVLAVPRRAVRRGADGATEVVLVVAGKAKVTKVTTGAEDAGWIQLREGIAAGDVVVVEDPLGLADGAALEVLK